MGDGEGDRELGWVGSGGEWIVVVDGGGGYWLREVEGVGWRVTGNGEVVDISKEWLRVLDVGGEG